MLILFTLIYVSWGFLTVEICEEIPPFQLYNLENCDGGAPPRRTWDYDHCPNEGTWGECANFKCKYHHEEDGGWCRYGKTDTCDCCTKHNLKYAFILIETNGNSGTDARWNVFNFDIKLNGGDVSINGSTFEDVYDYECDVPVKMLLSARLTYNDSCATKFELFINCTKVATLTDDDLVTMFGFCFLWFDFCISKTMIEIERESGNNEKVYSLGSYDVELTDIDVCAHFESINMTSNEVLPYPIVICNEHILDEPTAATLFETLKELLGKCLVKCWWRVWGIIAFIWIPIMFIVCILLILILFYILWYKKKGKGYFKLKNAEKELVIN